MSRAVGVIPGTKGKAWAMPSLVTGLTMLATTGAYQSRESASCQANIVSATVVATFCGHREGDNEILDLLILWRGGPGWFQDRYGGNRRGGGGSRVFGGGTKGAVSAHETYGDVRIAFDADFDTNVAIIGESRLTLDHINTVRMDRSDGDWHMAATRWTDPRLPLSGDWNVALARRSSELLRDLDCDVPMPTASANSYTGPRLPVITVCEKLKHR